MRHAGAQPCMYHSPTPLPSDLPGPSMFGCSVVSCVCVLVWLHQLSVLERRLDEFSVEEAASALWALGALGYTVSLKVSINEVFSYGRC